MTDDVEKRRCDVCGGTTLNTGLPVRGEVLVACDDCQRGLWEELKPRWSR